MRISDIKPGAEHITLVAKVIEMGQVRQVETRFGPARVATAIIEDETGRINLKLWRDQIDQAEVGHVIRLENAFAAEFRGVKEISIGRTGRITALSTVGEH